MMKSVLAPGTLYSYGPWFTTGVTPPKLSCGGGVAVIHSRVVDSHGFWPAFLPLAILQKRLMTKRNCAVIVMIAAYVMNLCTGSSGARYFSSVNCEYRRGFPAMPR